MVHQDKLFDIIKMYSKVAIAFSGGVDSAYLLYASIKAGVDVKAYYVKSQFQPEHEMADALRLRDLLNANMEVIELNVLAEKDISSNPKNRCYYCKNRIFSSIIEAASKDGYDVIFDGTNASDEEGDRPGMKALRELKVISPLREALLTKDEIRRLSKEASLFTWDKPAYACLATRVASLEEITEEKLVKIEKAEDYLFSLGLNDFRVRLKNNTAKIQIKENDFENFIRHKDNIRNEFLKYFEEICLDLKFR